MISVELFIAVMLFYPQVKEDSYKAHKELQLHMEYAKKPNKCYEPIHLHLAHQQELKKELARSESILQKLGNFAALVNQMIVQSLVTITRQDVISFLNNVLKVREEHLLKKSWLKHNSFVTAVFNTQHFKM